jgi:hypothetical protein
MFCREKGRGHRVSAQWEPGDELGGLGTDLVCISSDDVDLGRNRAEVLVRLLVTHVAGADNLLDLAGHEQTLELCWQVGHPARDVQVSEDQDEHHGQGRDEMSRTLGNRRMNRNTWIRGGYALTVKDWWGQIVGQTVGCRGLESRGGHLRS